MANLAHSNNTSFIVNTYIFTLLLQKTDFQEILTQNLQLQQFSKPKTEIITILINVWLLPCKPLAGYFLWIDLYICYTLIMCY